jgi:hypothetical protein
MDTTEKPEKPYILPLEWKSGFGGFVRVETGEMPFGPDTGWVRNVIHPGSFRAPISGFRTDLPVPQEMMPTPTENIVLNAYFWKIFDLHGF